MGAIPNDSSGCCRGWTSPAAAAENEARAQFEFEEIAEILKMRTMAAGFHAQFTPLAEAWLLLMALIEASEELDQAIDRFARNATSRLA
jgi:hypothetical protein